MLALFSSKEIALPRFSLFFHMSVFGTRGSLISTSQRNLCWLIYVPIKLNHKPKLFILGISISIFLDEFNFYVYTLHKADHLTYCGPHPIR
jgi:hypothetical protein